MNINLTATVRDRSGGVTPIPVMIDGDTPVHTLDRAVRAALYLQTQIESEDCVTILKISYTPEG
jgi:hypothetical protein